VQRFARGSAAQDTARADCETALAGARAAGDRELEMEVLNALGTHFHVLESERAIQYHEESLAIAEELGLEAGQVAALNRLSLVHANQLELERALEVGERALALAEQSGDETSVAQAMDSLKFVALMLGDTDRLEELTAALAAGQRRRDDIWFLQWTLFESAFTPTVQGDFGEAERRLDEALGISRRLWDPVAGSLMLAAQCSLERSRGRYAEALRVGAEAVRTTHEGASDIWLGWTAAARAQPLADLRLWPEAVASLEDGLAAADRIAARGQQFSCLGDLAWARLRAGDADGARAAAERWDEVVDEVPVPSGHACLYSRTSYTGRARVALALGERERAESILASILEPAERSLVRDAVADVHAALAECARDRGDGAQAVRLLGRGLELLGTAGFPAERLRLELALAELDAGAEHAAAATALIDEMAASVTDTGQADRFRTAALADLNG
jgi:tetratricopeptide (TPR) repeat protein